MLADNGTVRNIHYGDILIKYGEFVNTAVDSIPYIKDDSYCPPYKNILKCGDVVFTDAAEDNTVGKCCEIISSENDLLVAGLHTIPVRPNCIFNEKFLGYYLNSDAFHDQLIPYIQGTKVSSISRKALNSSFVKFPPSAKEQKNISNFLSSILKNISNTQAEISRLRQVKAASLQAMFPQESETVPRLRFKGFIDQWKKCTIGDVATFSKGQGYSKADIKDSGTPIILYGSMYTNYSTVIESIGTYADIKNGSVISKGDEILIPASGETPEDIAIASHLAISGVIIGGDLNIINVDKSFLSPTILCLAITYTDTHRELSSLSQGKSVVHLHNGDIAMAHISFPSLGEQRKIADFFQNLDRQISLTEAKLEKLKQIKSACLNLMFV